MECWRGGKNPFLSTSYILLIGACPWIISATWSMSKSEVNNVEEVQEALRTQIATITTNYIPPLERVRIVEITSWHTSLSEEMLREECLVYSNEEQEKLCLPVMLWILATCLFTYPEVKRCKDTSYCSHTLYIVKVRYHVVSVMLCYINPCISKNNSSKPTNGKQNQETNCKKHRCCKPQRTTINSSKPTKNFNSSGYCNNHSSTSKICTCVHIKPYGVHVVCPYKESLYRNGPHSVHHSNVTKNRLTSKEAQYVTYNTKGRQNQYIYFGVSEKPELMLVLNNVPPSCWLEEGCVKVTVSK
jgi:hypothetical protein